jgi:GT2 family glycosyltransferase/glycosyltransferase involved in cell wall biosynthesis
VIKVAKLNLQLWKGLALLNILLLEKWLTGFLGGKFLYRLHLCWLVKRTKLFDAAYYLEVNHDVTAQGRAALEHYIAYGDREGRCPMPFFDPNYYRTQVQNKLKNTNTLLHYAYVGRYRRLSLSPWFDVSYYLRENKDVARSGTDPLLHYVKWGGREGRSPCAQFDGRYYLQANQDVISFGINPLYHYLRYGRFEGRNPIPDPQEIELLKTGDELPKPALPAESDWHNLTLHGKTDHAVVDVIVPVYKGRAETLRCLYSVLLATTKIPFELVVINDASSEQDLVMDLNRLAHLGLFTLHTHSKNRGFVASVNQGMLLHPGRDVVLLNSDTEVYDGWLDRLYSASLRHKRTATVTPLSNNATICSYPRFLHDNPYPLELGYAELDALAAVANAEIEVEAPTAVGFCMYIKRDCLAEIGVFDEVAFGKGYGEENDFCQRAIKKNWRNIIAADVFVHHWGSVSFQGEKAKRINDGLKVIAARYPDYQQDIQCFIKNDPLHESRSRLDWARLKQACKKENILLVSHNRGGGSERCVQETIRQLNKAGQSAFLMRPASNEPGQVLLTHSTIPRLLNLKPLCLADSHAIQVALKDLRITQIHIHGLVDFTPNAPDIFIELAHTLGTRLEVTIHDYKAICPRINLIDLEGRYCGEPDETECNRCLKERGSVFDVFDINAWRTMRGRLLQKADRVLVPDQDVANRLQRYFPYVTFTVFPHEEIDVAQVQPKHPLLKSQENLKIVVIGAIGKIKGYNVLYACAQDAKRRQLPLEFIVMGYSLDDELLKKTGVQITGRYLEYEAIEKLTSVTAHVAWLPSLWPETYSYTLSLALNCKLPVFAFELGAIATRLHTLNQAQRLMPLGKADDPAEINNLFLQYRSQRIDE